MTLELGIWDKIVSTIPQPVLWIIGIVIVLWLIVSFIKKQIKLAITLVIIALIYGIFAGKVSFDKGKLGFNGLNSTAPVVSSINYCKPSSFNLIEE